MKQQRAPFLSFSFHLTFYSAFLAVILLFAASMANAQITTTQTPATVRTLPIDLQQLTAALSPAPKESSAAANTNPLFFALPMPDGSDREFSFVRNSLMAPDFAAQFPDFQTYSIQAADDPKVTGHVTLTPHGLLATIFTEQGMIGIWPEDMNNPVVHQVTFVEMSQEDLSCAFDEDFKLPQLSNAELSAFSNGATTRTYQLAIVTTGEYGQTHGGTVPLATAVVTQMIGALEDIYEKELAVKFQLLTPLIYLDPNTDPFPSANSNRTLMAAEAVAANWPNPADYDLGHVLHSTGGGGSWGGGIAYFGLCNDGLIPPSTTGRYKGGAWSSVGTSPTGAVGLMAHEMGHQFYMPHSFNGTGGSCTANIEPTASYEIGSGTTIMSYNGSCQANNNIPSSGAADNYFHTYSLEQAVNRMLATACASSVASGNTPPVVNANPCGGAYTIPIGTPFRLTGSGTDADGDQIYYSWEQHDEDGAGTPTQGFIGTTAAGSAIAPLFRSYPPTTSPSRTFPVMSLVTANDYASSFEPLPTVARTLNFHLTGRDWKTVGGGIHCSALAVTVSTSGPSTVTAPNGGETIAAGGNTTVTWAVNGTNAFCTNVNIRLSIDGGLTFPYTLLANTPNDGTQSVALPVGVTNTTTARMMVECADNVCVVFFDISNGNFTVTSACNAAFSNICPTAAMSLPAGDPGLNLGLSNHYGSAVTQNTFSITAGSPTGPLANATAQGGNTCQTPWGTEKYATFDLTVSTTGSFTFTNISGGQTIFSIFTAAGYNPSAPCSSTFLGSNAWGAITWGSSSTVTLTACTVYKLVVWTLSGANGTPTITFSGAGTIYSSGAGPGAGYSYTYAAVSTTNSQITAVSATSNFTSLVAGSYNIYGASYYSGAGPTPPTVNPATWVGQTIAQILSGGSCALFSTNFKPLTVTGGAGTPSLAITGSPSLNEGNAGMTAFTFTVTRTGSITDQSSASWAVTGSGADPANGADFSGGNFPSGTVIFPAGSAATQTITVNVNGDTDFEPNEGFTVTLSNPSNATISIATATGTILNDDMGAGCAATYCAASQTDGTCGGPDEFISNVTFNTINNSSTCAQSLPAGYTNYTGINSTVTTGTAYALNVTNGGPFTGDQCKAWFDWNADGDFTDAGEEFTLTGTGANNAQNWTVSVPVPGGATLGSTRMRVRVTYTGSIVPCGALQYGEAEDYCITVNAGCTPPIVSAPTVTQPSCAVPTGTIVVNATGGGTLEYSKDNGTNWQASATFSSLAPGNYTIKVRLQANPSCMTAYSMNPVVIDAVPTAPDVTAPTVTQPTCATPTGTIVVNATGGGILEYSVDNGTNWQTSSTFSGLAAGSYTIKVRLQANPTCMTAYGMNPVVIDAVPTAPNVTAPTVTQPTCATPTGTIVVNATGGGTLEYSVDNGTNWQTSSTFSGLAPGNYTIKVRLQANPTCMTAYGMNPVVIDAVPTAPDVTAPTVTQPTCATPTGTIVVNATGGGILEYSVDNGTNWQTSSTFSGLAAGSYTIKVRLQANPTCMTAYAQNPVVLLAPVGCDPCTSNTYCATSQTFGTCAGGDEYISNVTFGTINNASACAQSLPAGYTDYTGMSTTVSTGTAYTLDVTNGGPYSGGGDQCKAWFDWNADGDFTDAGEEFTLTGSGQYNSEFWTVSVPVPGGATLGSTRMRVRVAYTGTVTPCGVLDYGEAEDYCITINDGCPATLPVTGAIVSGTYQASMDVTSDGTVQGGATVVFKGGNSVTLQPLFEVPLGAVFEAIIGVCTP